MAAEALADHADEKLPLETGGTLLGYWSDGDEVLIQDVTGPGPNAVHERHRFVPDHEWQRETIAERYDASGRITTYLGDWHTHPAGGCTPSERDVRTARAIRQEPAARAPRPMMLILGGGTDGWRHVLYELQGRRLRAVDLRQLAQR